MTYEEAMNTLTEIFLISLSCLGAKDKETAKKYNQALQMAHKCMERCKRIDEEAEKLYAEADRLVTDIVKAKMNKDDKLYGKYVFELEMLLIDFLQTCRLAKGEE